MGWEKWFKEISTDERSREEIIQFVNILFLLLLVAVGGTAFRKERLTSHGGEEKRIIKSIKITEKPMPQEFESKKSLKFSYTGLFMGAGLVLGGILGLLIDNLAFSAGGGMILGLALGLAFEKKRKLD